MKIHSILSIAALALTVACSGSNSSAPQQPAQTVVPAAPAVPNTPQVTLVAGTVGVTGVADGQGAAATFDDPEGIAVDASGNVYVADSNNDTIRKIDPQGNVTTFAGTPGDQSYRLTMIAFGPSASFFLPQGIAIDAFGNLYVADQGYDLIRKITPAAGVTVLAGYPDQTGDVDAQGLNARFYQPFGVALDASGNVYVADSTNGAIRKVDAAGNVTTFATGLVCPTGLALDANGNVFLADWGSDTIRKITPDGTMTIFAGAFQQIGLTDGQGPEARFSMPTGICIDPATGNLYVADEGNSAIRKITPEGVVRTVTVLAGEVMGDTSSPRGIAWDSTTASLLITGDQVVRRVKP